MQLPPLLNSLWHSLTRPHPSIDDPEDQRRAYTLSVIMIILLAITPLALIPIVSTAEHPESTLVIGIVGTLFGVFNYAVSRTRYYRIAGFLIFLTISITCLSVAIFNNGADVLVFLAFGSLIAQLTLRFRVAILVVSANMLATIVLGITVPTWTEGIAEEVFFVIIMSVVIFVIGYTRNRDLDHIQEQADLLVATEWQMVELLLENEKVRILSEFIRNVSHDFRTPLSIIATKAYLINKSKSLEEQQRNMESINHQIGRLTQLIDGMLAMSKLDSDLEIEMETIDIGAVLEEVVYKLNGMAGEKQIKLHINLPETLPRLHANTKWLEDALSEVIKNGIIYTPAGGEVVINGTYDTQTIIIEICDTGIGIPEEDTDHIFERLFRGDKTRASTGGVGLGLSIAKRVVELHEGEISVESTVGKGSVFRITLPLSSDPVAKRLMPTS